MTAITTDTFEFELPDDWAIESMERPVKIIGPAGEVLMINSAVVSPGETERDRQAVRAALEENTEESMQNAAEEADLEVTRPLEKRTTDAGWLVAELHCEVAGAGAGAWFSEFTIAGPATLVLVTVEGQAGCEGSIELVRDAVDRIAWQTPAEQPGDKPLWKLW